MKKILSLFAALAVSACAWADDVRVTSLDEFVEGTTICMKVNVSGQSSGWFGMPNGSADTPTYFTIVDGQAEGTIRLMKSETEYIGYSSTTYVSAENATDIYLEKDGEKFLFKNDNGTTSATKALALANETALPAAWWDRGAAPRIRLEVYKQGEASEGPVVADKFYMLKNGAYGQSKSGLTGSGVCGYMEAVTVTAKDRNTNRTFAFNGLGADGAAFSRVFQFVPSGDNYYLKAQGSYMSKLVDGSVGCTENQNDAALFSITATTNEGYYYLIDTKQSSNTCKYAQLSDWWGFGIGGWNPGNAGSSDDLRCQWAFEEVESVDVALTTVGEASYATLYAPYAVSLDSNVKAYTATVSGDYLVATEVTGEVPALTAVILVSESKAEKATATLVSNSTAEAPANDLLGVCRATAAEGALVLGDNEGIGFYSFSGATLGANKAYYTAPAASNGLRISFSELTGIISAAQQNGGQAIFDLQGRRVVEAKGLNIVNGKKVIR